MHEDFWTFLPTHKLVLLTNHKPVIRETKDAIWMRVHLVPWLAMFTGSRQDTSLGDTLKAEASGILAWAVRGCLEWQRIGLAPPEAVLAATQQYREDEDLLGAFLTDHCVLGEACTVGATDLFVAYKEWAEENNEPALTQKKFGTALKERGEGFTQERDSKTGRATWRGLRLSGEARAGAEESPLFWSSPVEDV
jgi:putative DNA primase/helicase